MRNARGFNVLPELSQDEDLVARISEAAASVREIPGILERVLQLFLRRCQSCMATGGRNFEQLFSFGMHFAATLRIQIIRENCTCGIFADPNSSEISRTVKQTSSPIKMFILPQWFDSSGWALAFSRSLPPVYVR
ncbi:hypothetical protein TNCV_2721781 [Trichonephila clavipes]|nr:hypothetical protein TNCV_2721781 [Trichonephila clavipes]